MSKLTNNASQRITDYANQETAGRTDYANAKIRERVWRLFFKSGHASEDVQSDAGYAYALGAGHQRMRKLMDQHRAEQRRSDDHSCKPVLPWRVTRRD